MEAQIGIGTNSKLEVDGSGILRGTIVSSVASVFLLAGTHGDERGGLQGIKVAHEGGIKTCIVNPEAVFRGVRYVSQDINRFTSEGCEHDRFGELQRILAQSVDNPYYIDLHNCNGTAKLGIVFSELEIHKQMAIELGLDALLIFETEIGAGTVVEKLNSSIGSMGMIVETGLDIDTHGETSEDIAKRLVHIDQRIQSGDNLTGGSGMKLSIPILKISILRDIDGYPIIDSHKISTIYGVPDYCIMGRGGQFWVIKNEDNTYPEEDLIKSTIEML